MRPLLPFVFVALSFQVGLGQSVLFTQELQGERLPIGYALSWKTTSEAVGLTFVLERSKDGLAFELFHEEVGKSGSSGSSYHVLVPDSQTEQWMYRLRTIKAGRTVSASPLLREDQVLNDYTILGFVQSGIKNKFEIQIESRSLAHLSFTLLNKDRQILQKGKWPLHIGIQSYALDITTLEKGSYTLVLANDAEVEEMHFKIVEPGTAILSDLSLD